MGNNHYRNSGKPSKRGPKLPKKPALGDQRRGPFGYLLILALVLTGMTLFQTYGTAKDISFKQLIQLLKEGCIEKIVIGDTEITGKFKADAQVENHKPGSSFHLVQRHAGLGKADVPDAAMQGRGEFRAGDGADAGSGGGTRLNLSRRVLKCSWLVISDNYPDI